MIYIQYVYETKHNSNRFKYETFYQSDKRRVLFSSSSTHYSKILKQNCPSCITSQELSNFHIIWLFNSYNRNIYLFNIVIKTIALYEAKILRLGT